ncbi:hypothetical protein [Agaribacterium sp. ZY112]|uniref:hypothetical protein n=1 Tax=Agaribacterium sp. ZY112 TaxID=3233574 RepID=UPI00352666A3
MSQDSIQEIRRIINEAHARDEKQLSLKAFVSERLSRLHRSINLPGEQREESLQQFLQQYVEHVPAFLDALLHVAEQAKLEEFVGALIRSAQQFFSRPPELLDEHRGIEALIDEAYYAHRLMEEVNDRILLQHGIPLTPMDMTLSNIIVHSLLGDEFSNELDLAVHYHIDVLFEDTKVFESDAFLNYISLHKTDGFRNILEDWPCLAGDSAIELKVSYSPSHYALH